MARLPRLSIAGYPHHVIQRGNNRQPVFRDASDYERYLGWLQELAQGHELAVHAYVLMPNHVHLLATPAANDALSRVMQALGRRYVRHFNDKYGRSGTLWEGRFRSAIIDSDRYLLTCSRYIELNPVRAGLAPDPGQYRWSSYAHHVGLRVDPLISDHALFWALGNTPFERQSAYRGMFDAPLQQDALDDLRRATNRGWSLGDFSDEARASDTWPTPRPRGRPRKRGTRAPTSNS
jgi:putative transposase